MAGDPASRTSPYPGISHEVFEAYAQAPSHMVAEVIDGELSLMPRPRPRHASAAMSIGSELIGFSKPRGRDPGGWVILPEPELHLGARPDILDPDIAGWRRERLPEEPEGAAITVVPDWVCEILSDSTEALDRGKKRRVYRREGVTQYWICDPRIQTLEVYRLVNGRWIEVDTYEGDVTVRAEPFDAIEIDLARLWRW
ncbi:MAG: Uma2 family endonuclease [Polyangiales bacterium]